MGLVHHAWGQRDLHCFHAEGDLQYVLSRPGSKFGENFGASVRSRLNPYDMGVIGRAHERTDGLGKGSGQRRGQERGKRSLRWLGDGPRPWEVSSGILSLLLSLGCHAMLG